jgi:hypothetical protein
MNLILNVGRLRRFNHFQSKFISNVLKNLRAEKTGVR